MAKTNFYAELELIDTTALKDASASSLNNQSFADIELFKEQKKQKEYGTLEYDFFILDGTKEEMPDVVEDIPFFSSDISDENGDFSTPQEFEINFTENHTSYGLTFCFAPDHPLKMKITWYDLLGIEQDSKIFDVDSELYFAQDQISDYQKIKVEFLKAKPHRYIKVNYVQYGTMFYFGNDGYPVKAASLVEETDPISDKLAISNLTFKMIDEEEDYNPANASGLHTVLQKGQRILAYEERNGETDFLGTYFMNKWSNSNNLVSFTFQDYKGQLDNYTFKQGKVYNGDLAKTIIKEIMNAAEIYDFEIEESVGNTKLYGYLKIQSCRKALREVLFATGAVIDTTRTEKIRIHSISKTSECTIMRDRKFSTTVKNNEYVSDVAIKYSRYVLDQEASEIVNAEYLPGIYTVELPNPAIDYSITGGEIVESYYNYIVFRVSSSGTVVITGKQFEHEELTATKSMEAISAGQTRLTKTFTASLANAELANIIAQRILDFYSLSLGISVKFLSEGEKNGIWGVIQNKNKEFGDYLAVMEKMNTDLTGGYITTGTLRGYYKLVTDFYHTTELISGDDTGVL